MTQVQHLPIFLPILHARMMMKIFHPYYISNLNGHVAGAGLRTGIVVNADSAGAGGQSATVVNPTKAAYQALGAYDINPFMW